MSKLTLVQAKDSLPGSEEESLLCHLKKIVDNNYNSDVKKNATTTTYKGVISGFSLLSLNLYSSPLTLLLFGLENAGFLKRIFKLPFGSVNEYFKSEVCKLEII